MLYLDFIQIPVLLTERLILRPLRVDDAAEIHLLRSNESVNKYIDREASTCIEDAESHIRMIESLIKEKKSVTWAITLKESTTLIGTICFWNFNSMSEIVEIGYEMLPASQGKGLMIEAAKMVIQFGFEQMNVQSITAFSSTQNLKSVALLEKLNFSDAHTYSVLQNLHENLTDTATYILNR
ncbi:GNAT family N-acetyltransferase [Arcticibacter eurypsychrophilus]|uniref:GNAT family N-acetyltransferase n=1 Tax=Arcticibacter eurypsychrophilus TaxID=1434752 RepID=UPI00084D97C2|nr:GNAT family N-acetyltransferase [Arcticibacter eurypsychrophilus]